MPHCAAMYIPSCLLINFGDPATATSDIRFLKQATGLDIGRLKSTYWVYNKVCRRIARDSHALSADLHSAGR